MADLLKNHIVFLAMLGFVQVNKSNTGQKYKVMFKQISNSFSRPTLGSEAPTCHSKKMSVFDGVYKNKYAGDIVCTLVSCLPSTI